MCGAWFAGREQGLTLIETLGAIAVLGVVVSAFLNGLSTSSKAAMVADEQATAESLAISQMEWVKKADYATTYNGTAVPSDSDYTGYTVDITATTLDDGIQKITVTVERNDKTLTSLEGYKVNR